jgi:hypothetical protein
MRRNRLSRGHRRSYLMAAGVAGLTLLASTETRADIIRSADMLRGTRVTYAQCMAAPNTVWVRSYGRDFCIRYYMSAVGGDGLRPLVFLQGDRPWTYHFRSGTFTPHPGSAPSVDFDTDKAGRWMANLSKMAKVPAIYLARVGVDGSSGFHGVRKTMLELHAMNAALNAIKRRHGFTGFHLVGQSGGAKLVGGLLALRTDIACAVPGSGPLDVRENRSSPDPGQRFFNAGDFAPTIARVSTARILLVTDRTDKLVSAEQQIGFVRKLRRAGGQAGQFFVRATDRWHHGVARYASLAAAECIRGASDDEISMKLADAVARTPPEGRRDERARFILSSGSTGRSR